jgi:hypothetical protein
MSGGRGAIDSVEPEPEGAEGAAPVAVLALGSGDGTASLVSARTGERTHHLQGLHTNAISSVALSADGAVLALGSGDGTASLVSARTGERLHHLQGLHTQGIASVALSADGAVLALGSNDGTASLVSARTGERLHHLEGLHTNAIASVALSADGAVLALGSWDGTASLVSARTGERLHHLQGLHTGVGVGPIWGVALAVPDGSLERWALEADAAAAAGTRIWVEGHGWGRYVSFRRNTFAANDHTIDFDAAAAPTTLRLRSCRWRLGGDAPAEGVPPTSAAAAAAQRADVERRLAAVAQRQGQLEQRHAADAAALLAEQGRARQRQAQEVAALLAEQERARQRQAAEHAQQLAAQAEAQQRQAAEQLGRLQALEAEQAELERLRAALDAYVPPMPPPPDSPMSGRSLASSEFKGAYGRAAVPQGAMDLGMKLGKLLEGYCQEHGIDWQSEGEPFMQKLQQEALQNLADPIDQMMQRMWTSAVKLRGREFCFIFNDALRGDSAALAASVAALSRGVNTLCVSVPPRPPFPPNDVCFRGGGFDDRYRGFFVPRRHFRIPNYFATSFSQAVADGFLRRSTMASKVRWVVRVDPVRRCVHVNLVTKRVPGLPDEQEYLFAPYSTFTVRSVQWNAGSDAEPHVIELVAAVDNKAEPEDLPLAPWS